MFIQEEKTRKVWGMTLGVAAGILLGGSVASVENRVCAASIMPAETCLAAPKVRVMNGMVGGAFAAGGALLLLELWSRVQTDD